MNKLKKMIVVFTFFAIFSGFLPLSNKFYKIQSIDKIEIESCEYFTSNQKEYIHLSDLDYISENNFSYAGWGSIGKDKNPDGKIIKVRVDGEIVPYSKGMGVHAKGQLTYDISSYSKKYSRFVSKIGVDASKGAVSSLWFRFLVSNDKDSWTQIYQSSPISSVDDAISVDLDIEGYKYLRIYIDPNGKNDSDHGVLADPRLVTSEYVASNQLYEKIHPLEYYDDVLKNQTMEDNYKNNFRLILEREFVNKIGYWTIQDISRFRPDSLNAIEWILSSDKNLKQVIEVGEISDAYTFMNVLGSLYKKYKDDLKDENGEVYQKMMIGLAAAYSTDRIASPLGFSYQSPTYDYMERFRLIKNLFDEGLLYYGDAFKNYHVELMRMLMQDGSRNDEILWLNYYTKVKNYNQSVYAYVNHIGKGTSYNDAVFHDLAYKEVADNRWHLSEYQVPFGDNINRIWMVMQKGGICWNQSRVFQSLFNSVGSPTAGAYQPEHEAAFYYLPQEDGTGRWNLANNIFGWGKTGTTWYGGNRSRTLFNWANKYFTNQSISNSNTGNSAGYMLLGQASLNRYKGYQKSLYYNLLANSYENQNDKLEIYNEALKSLEINLDSYEKIIDLYKVVNKDSSEWKVLAEKIIDAYTFYPNAMFDLLKVIKPYLNGIDKLEINYLEHDALLRASKATKDDVLQEGATKEIAKVLLGKSSPQLATFSFDGENAGKIIVNSEYQQYDLSISYSLDGGNTISNKTTNHVISLTQEEIERITAENDIELRLDGTSTVYKIDILDGVSISDNVEQNDDENRFIGTTNYLEYSLDNGNTWITHTLDTDIIGNVVVLARYGAHGVYLSGPIKEYQFTDNNPPTNQYIKVENLSYISSWTSQGGQAAQNMIDASPFTTWHTTYGQVAQDKSYVVSLNKARYLSGISYDPAGLNGKIKNVEVYVSVDNKEWTLAGTATNWANNSERKTLTFAESIPAKYVKIVATATYGNSEGPNKYVSGKRFNFYEDQTKTYEEIPIINYSTTSITNQDVVATIQLPSDYEIVGKLDYTFTQNGDYTFQYKNSDGEIKSIKAHVDWIDKTPPTAKIRYSTTSLTSFSVEATLYDFSKKNIKIINSSSLDSKKLNTSKYSYTFTSNGQFTFELQDEAGNIGYVTAKVSWIDNTPPKAEVQYKNTNKGSVIVSVINPSEEIKFTNGKSSYEIHKNGVYQIVFYDKAGNVGKVDVVIDWLNNSSQNKTSSKQDTKSKDTETIEDNPKKDIDLSSKTDYEESKDIDAHFTKSSYDDNSLNNNRNLLQSKKNKKIVALVFSLISLLVIGVVCIRKIKIK